MENKKNTVYLTEEQIKNVMESYCKSSSCHEDMSSSYNSGCRQCVWAKSFNEQLLKDNNIK